MDHVFDYHREFRKKKKTKHLKKNDTNTWLIESEMPANVGVPLCMLFGAAAIAESREGFKDSKSQLSRAPVGPRISKSWSATCSFKQPTLVL